MQLNYHLYMNQTGYSIASQDYVLAIRSVDPEIEFKLNYMNIADLGVSKNRRQIFSAMKNNKPKAPRMDIYHCIPSRYRRHPGAQKYIGMCLFETMTPPKQWISTMNEMDMILTASEFNKRTFENEGVKTPIHIIPHCFDPSLFNKDVAPAGRYSQFTFMAMGTWKQRKNWETLIKAFYDAFENKDNVCLLAKTDKGKELKAMVQRIKKTGEWRGKDTAPIYADDGVADFEKIPQIMKKADVYISPSLGEGFGLPGMHAMALGIPIITTKYGGVLEYAKQGLCTYIEPKSYKTYPSMDGIPQFNKCIWPVIKISDIRDSMRQVHSNFRQIHKTQVPKAYDFVHNNFNYEVIGKKFLEAISS